VRDREGMEYTESVYRLIRAFPETLMDWSVIKTKQATTEDYPSGKAKKRKFDDMLSEGWRLVVHTIRSFYL
jgi:hypothetical protein